MPAPPPQIQPESLADYFEALTKEVFHAGISWRVIDAKWDGFRAAFDGFDPEKIAAYTPDDVDRLAADTRIVRNRRKIEATVDNAETMIGLDAEHGGFDHYLGSLGGFDAQSKALISQFKWLGDTGAYAFLYIVGEEVPPHDEWRAGK